MREEATQLESLMTVTEVARFLNVTEPTVRSLCASGEIPARRVGSQWRIHPSVLEEFRTLENLKCKEKENG